MDTPICLDAPMYVRKMFGCLLYICNTNIQGGIWGHPNMQGGHPNVWGHMDTPLVWQSMLSLCCVCTGGIQTYGGAQLFLHYPELYLPCWISAILFFFLIFYPFFKIFLWVLHCVLIGTACCKVSDILSYILPTAAKVLKLVPIQLTIWF